MSEFSIVFCKKAILVHKRQKGSSRSDSSNIVSERDLDSHMLLIAHTSSVGGIVGGAVIRSGARLRAG